MALVTALEKEGDSDSDGENHTHPSHPSHYTHSSHTDCILCADELDPLLQSVQAPTQRKIKIRRRSTKPTLASADSAENGSGDNVDVLINILQDPDTGAPRPSATALNNVRLRTGKYL